MIVELKEKYSITLLKKFGSSESLPAGKMINEKALAIFIMTPLTEQPVFIDTIQF